MQKQVIPSHDQLLKQAKSVITHLKTLQTHAGWEKTGDKPCDLYKMGIDNLMASKGIAVVNYPLEQVVTFLDAIGNLGKLDQTCIAETLIHKVGDIQIVYLRFSAPWPISHRDFITVTYKFSENANKFYLGSKSCNYPYPEVDKVVRGEVIVGGYILERIDNKSTKVTYMSNADIKGSIPTIIKNELSKKQGLIASRIEQAMSGKK